MKTRILFSISFMFVILSLKAQLQYRQINEENDTLRKHLMSIVRNVHAEEEELEVLYHLKYTIPANKSRLLAYYLREREWRKACYNYIHKDSISLRVLCKMELDSVYRDSINSVLIPEYRNNISGENVSLALSMAKVLKLDTSQYQYIMDKALEMARILFKNPRSNVWNDEMNILKNTLEKKQLKQFFINKNSKIVTKLIDDGWQRIVNAGLSEELDSITEIPRAYFFCQERQMIKDLYRYQGTSQKRNLTELEKRKPPMIRILDTLEKEERLKKQNNNNKSIGKEIIW